MKPPLCFIVQNKRIREVLKRFLYLEILPPPSSLSLSLSGGNELFVMFQDMVYFLFSWKILILLFGFMILEAGVFHLHFEVLCNYCCLHSGFFKP
jgi:hypothetical protein